MRLCVAAVGWQLPVRFPQVVPPVNYSLPLFLPPLTGENSLPPLTGGKQTVNFPLTVSFFSHTLHHVLNCNYTATVTLSSALHHAQLQLHRHSYFILHASPRTQRVAKPPHSIFIPLN